MDELKSVGTKLPGYFCMILLPNCKVAIVDPWWWVRIHKFKWRVKKSRGGWYAYLRLKVGQHTKYIYMHRMINRTPKGLDTHHSNYNTLDNREENLEEIEPATHSEQKKMRRISKYDSEIPFATLCGIT